MIEETVEGIVIKEGYVKVIDFAHSFIILILTILELPNFNLFFFLFTP